MQEEGGNRPKGDDMRPIYLIIAGCVSALVIVPVFVYLSLLGFYDENPSEQMLAVISKPTPEVVKSGNAWLAFLGFDAPDSIDPFEFGTQKMRRLEQKISSGEIYSLEKAAQTDESYPSFKVKGDLPKLNKAYNSGALKYARSNSKKVEKLIRENRDLVDRYEALRQYTEYAEPVDYSFYTQFPKLTLIRDAQYLWRLKLARLYDKGNKEAAVRALKDDIFFWSFIAKNSRIVIGKLIAITCLNSDFKLAAELGANPASNLKQYTALSDMLRPFNKDETLMTEAFIGELRAMLKVVEITNESARTKGRMGFKLNATRNRVYENWTRALALSKSNSQEYAKEVAALKGSSNVDHRFSIARLYNPAGEALAGLAEINAYRYIERGHELEGLRRLALLKILLRTEKISQSDIEKFLDSRKADLGNPYTGEPMKWDPKQQSLYFDKISGNGKVEIYL
jgi:hypothetical protein